MMHAALGIWILSAVICVGRGDHHYGHSHGDQNTGPEPAPPASLCVSHALAALSVGARSMTHNNRLKPKPEFLETLKQSYFAEGFNVDFTQTAEKCQPINKYVEDKTNGKIAKLVEAWIQAQNLGRLHFDAMLTKEDFFNVDDNNKVAVQMMNMEDTFDSYYDQAINTSVLHLPFTAPTPCC
ncbi:hypothetical protein KUCAC02_028729 [Chaenocephalus aceratus]|uniref:Uncharacterized protein n=1 Tax=Chaenocephalus aceratus TaxID=36190 RepID=A0ACB9X4H4_CHAAC|nr:hypothetical protein KUCAC02_028729 [Chaenocephalus aceratus]